MQALLADELMLHDGDLSGPSSEGLQRDREPPPGGLTEWDDVSPGEVVGPWQGSVLLWRGS